MDIKNVERWGVDFGNVLVKNLPKQMRIELLEALQPTAQKFSQPRFVRKVDAFLQNYSSLIPHSLLGLGRLIENVGAENVYVISRAGNLERQLNTRLMEIYRIYHWTSLLKDHVIYVDEREDKARVCKELRINGHIDDRGEVLFHLQNIVPTLIWFAPTDKDYNLWMPRFDVPITIVKGWDQIMSSLD